MKNLKKILITFTLTAATVLTISTISKSATTLKVIFRRCPKLLFITL